MKGLEPSTFCMASRRSSQLSYIREGSEYSGRFGADSVTLERLLGGDCCGARGLGAIHRVDDRA